MQEKQNLTMHFFFRRRIKKHIVPEMKRSFFTMRENPKVLDANRKSTIDEAA